MAADFLTKKFVAAIGSYVGDSKHADKNTFDGTWMDFQRIRVSIDTSKPLKKE